MSTPLRRTGLFQALLKNKVKSTFFLVTFPAPQLADEWYRDVTNAFSPSNIERISPQYYLFDDSIMAGIELSLSSYIVVTNPPPMIFPALRYTNHVSGNWFAIRSLEDPGLYWCHEPSNRSVIVSRTRRSYFRIWIVSPVKPPGTIMIGTDKVRMSIIQGGTQPLYREDAGLHVLQGDAGNGRRPLEFFFSEFRNGFGAYQGNQIFNDVSSEEWELV